MKQTLLTGSLLAFLAVSVADNEHNSLRALGPADRIKQEWTECVGKSGEECVQIITRDLGEHPLRFLRPKIFVPRSKEDYDNTYYKVGISVNLMDEVTGDKNKGSVCYPLAWHPADGEPRSLGCWECGGMNGNDCCQMIKDSVPDPDINGNHLDCFIYEDPATPDLDLVAPNYRDYQDGYIAAIAPFFIMKFNYEYQVYVKLDIDKSLIQVLRNEKHQRLGLNAATMNQIMDDKRVSYDDLKELALELRLHTAPLMSAQDAVTDIFDFLKEHEGEQSLQIGSESYMHSVMTYLVHLIEVFAETRGEFFTPIHILVTNQNIVNIPPKLGKKFLPVQQFRPQDPEE